MQKVALGSLHGAVITHDRRLYTFGSNRYGQLGDPTFLEACDQPNVVPALQGMFRCALRLTLSRCVRLGCVLSPANGRHVCVATNCLAPTRMATARKEASVCKCGFVICTPNSDLFPRTQPVPTYLAPNLNTKSKPCF